MTGQKEVRPADDHQADREPDGHHASSSLEVYDAPEVATQAEARASVDATKADMASAWRRVQWQVQHRAWLALGYTSWAELWEAEYGGQAILVPRDVRPALVGGLRAEGLSQQAIADTLGVNAETVRRDVRDNPHLRDTQPTTRTDSLGRERPTRYAKPDQTKGELSQEAVAEVMERAAVNSARAVVVDGSPNPRSGPVTFRVVRQSEVAPRTAPGLTGDRDFNRLVRQARDAINDVFIYARDLGPSHHHSRQIQRLMVLTTRYANLINVQVARHSGSNDDHNDHTGGGHQ